MKAKKYYLITNESANGKRVPLLITTNIAKARNTVNDFAHRNSKMKIISDLQVLNIVEKYRFSVFLDL